MTPSIDLATATVEQVAQALLDRFGYVAVSGWIPRKIGEVVPRLYKDDTPLSHQTVIVSESSKQEYDAQRDFLGIAPSRVTYPYYYRVVAE